ncbi:MAG: DUF2272 domain-containing protein [Candidatus Tectimicrobiota bacterium]
MNQMLSTRSKISMAELQRLMRDPSVPESQIRPFFTSHPDASRPFAPAVIPNPARVDVAAPRDELEGAMMMDWANGLSRLRRQNEFHLRQARGDKRPVLVSEGDSWFQFPILIDDVIDQLASDFNIWSVDAAGDTLQNMVLEQPEYMEALREHADQVRAFLFSGAGNDFLGADASGRSVLAQVLKPFEAGKPAEWYLDTPAFADKLRFVEGCYRTVLGNIAAHYPTLPVLCHGYDYAIPGGGPNDQRHPIYATQDQWLGRPMREDLGITDPALQRAIIKLTIDNLNACLASLCGANRPGGAFKNAWHVDARTSVGEIPCWNDELHPTDAGFAKVAAQFLSVLQAAVPRLEARREPATQPKPEVDFAADGQTAYRRRLVAIANGEFDRFHEIAETDEPLRSRINQYCREIGIAEPDDIADFAWSAAFVSWCVKTAGATAEEFEFSPTHAVFVKAAIANADNNVGVWRARPIDAYRPQVGDIIHRNRHNGSLTYKQARTRSNYPSHSAIVVEIGSANGVKFARTIGGNERDSVRVTKVVLTADGFIAQRDMNPFICVIENLKVEAAPATPEAAFGPQAPAPASEYACEASGEPAEAQLEDVVVKPHLDRVEVTDHKSSRNGTKIDHVVIHYTTSRNIEGSISHFKTGSPRTSAHYIVGQDGVLVQMVPDAERAWHAGNSNMNARSIGIEHVAAAGDAITAAQAKTSLALIRWLMQEYGVPIANIIPHVCVKPTSCCGDLFKAFGGGAGLPCEKQQAALHKWLQASGIDGGGEEAVDETAAMRAPRLEASSPARRMAMAKIIVDFEARRDSQGRLVVYKLPEGDGGGRYEVAGINERYHKQECDELVHLIESGKHAQAEERAREFIGRFTDTAAAWCHNDAIEFYLRDCTFNRGPRGAARILQRAVGVSVDGHVGPQTLAAVAVAESQPQALLVRLREAREWYERTYVHRDESSLFWRGLVNRWKKALVAARQFLQPGLEAGFEITLQGASAPMSSQMLARMELADDATLPAGDDIEFIQSGPGMRPFDDIGEESPIDDLEKMAKGWRAYRNGLQPEENFEAVIGRDTSLPASFLQLLAEQRRAVGRISASGTNYQGVPGRWAGTGFLVGKNVLLTNHHVLNSPEVARAASIDFEYEVTSPEVLAGTQEPSTPPGKRSYRFDPARLFLTSPATGGGLDFTFVWIETDREAPATPITMRRAAFTIVEGEQAFVIHHPQGHGKRASVDDIDVVFYDATIVRYLSDTMPGSSGSPVFDRQGRLFALHHASKDGVFKRPDGRAVEVLNEGVKIGAIALDLDRRRTTSEKAMVEMVLGLVQGSDTMAGFFGNLGRENRIPAAASDVEAVVDAYRGSEADIDVGFWNIEWLANRYHEPVKLREAAALITDLGLDIWGLEEVSPPAVAALVQEIERNFGEKYAYALSEPDAPESKQSTAVLWKTKTVTGRQESWPEEIERFWQLRSTDNLDGLEAVEGKIFDRYPGLYRFSAKGRPSFDFYVVPLHLKAMAEGSKRRHLASRLLAKAVKLMTEKYSQEVDWVLGGDFNAELASNDFRQLLAVDLKPMSAADEQAGAFSYVKAPCSLIDHIFLSPNLVRHTDGDAYFIVAKDKTIDNYARKLSDHRPVLVRLSLGERPSEPPPAGNIDEQIESLLKSASAWGPRSSAQMG